MAKQCRECQGRGRWQERLESGGQVELIWAECNACKGTGIEQTPEAGEPFDIGGDSYATDDN